MKDLDLSNAEGLDESISENYSVIGLRGTLAAPLAAAPRPSLNLEIAPAPATAPAPTLELPIELGVGTATATQTNTIWNQVHSYAKKPDNAIVIPAEKALGVASIKPKLDAINIAPKEETTTLSIGEKLEAKEESSEDKTEKTSEKTAQTEGDKILGMPKMVVIGLGVVILAVGGFIAYKKFKK